MPDLEACPECGAVLPEGAEQCGLCGTPVPSKRDAAEASPSAEVAPSAAPGAASGAASSANGDAGTFCNECGWKNPPDANFCSRCGHELQSLPEGSESGHASPPGTKPAPPPPETGDAPHAETPLQKASSSSTTGPPTTGEGLGQRVALVVGVAALLVAGLYGWSAWNGRSSSGGGSESSAGEAAAGEGGGPAAPMMSGTGTRQGSTRKNTTRSGEVPEVIQQQQEGGEVPASIAARADSLRRVIDTRGGRHKRLARRGLGSLLAGAGLTKRAAAQQWLLAHEAGDDPTAWERAGSLLYDWMASLSRRDRAEAQERAQVARLAVDAYERVLESQPDNYDVRTNLAVAYLSTNNPMRGISEIKRVIRERPNHVGARFNYGLMQRMIGRNATAIKQFERVRKLAGEGSPYYRQAGQLIEDIKKQTGGNPQDAPAPGASRGGASRGGASRGGPSADNAPGGS